MSYEKNTWSNGDVITAEKLNHIEDGIENLNNDKFEVIEFSLSDASPIEPNGTETSSGVKGLYSKTINLSSPIQKSKIRSVWFDGMDWFWGTVANLGGNGDDIYQITIHITQLRSIGSLSATKVYFILEK